MSVITVTEDPVQVENIYKNYKPKPSKDLIKSRNDIKSLYKYVGCELTVDEFFNTTQFMEEPLLLYDEKTNTTTINTYHFFFMFYIETFHNYNKHLYNIFDNYEKMIEFMDPFCVKYKSYCYDETTLHIKTCKHINQLIYNNTNYIKQFIKARKSGIRAKKEFLLKRKLDIELTTTKEERFSYLFIYKIVNDIDENIEEFTNRIIQDELTIRKNIVNSVQQYLHLTPGYKRRRNHEE